MSFFGELRRRNVFRVGIAYLATVWVLLQVGDVVLPTLGAAAWIMQALVFSSALGFPLALVLAWFYELTPEGIRATADAGALEPVGFMGRRLDFAIIGLLVVAVGFLVVANYVVDGLPSSFEPSIAALPFSNESAAEENAEFFANGIHDELLTQLAKIAALKVISRTSVMEYRDSPKNMRQIGQELGVSTLLEGRVQRAGDMVRINVQLIDAATDEHIWAEVYDREVTADNLFAMQREMAMSIAAALEATLSPGDVSRLNEVPTDSTRAYDFYLSGNDYLHRIEGRTFVPLAVQQLENAVEEDPGFALAWAALTRAHTLMYWYGLDATEARMELASAAVERALELAPDLPETHLALGQYHDHRFGDYARALEEYAVAERGMPGSAEVLEMRARIYSRQRRFEEAIATLERAIELDPRNADRVLQQAGNYLSQRDYSRGEPLVERVLELAPDDVVAGLWEVFIPVWRDGDIAAAKMAAASSRAIRRKFYAGWIAALYERDYETALGYLDDWDLDVDANALWIVPKASYYGTTYHLAQKPELAERAFQAARVQLEDALEANPDDARLVVSLAEALAGLGEHDAGVRLAHRAMELWPNSQAADRGAWIQLDAVVRVFARAADYDALIEQLEAYLAGPGWWSIEGLLPDPRLDGVRDDPRFQALVEEYGRQ